MRFSDFIANTLLLDLETTRSGRIRHIGAVLNDTIFETSGSSNSKVSLERLDELAQNADFILGHNLLGHDFPVLKSTFPRLGILNKPVIDTLYLSPLAFPQNPYHHLVKNYKLVRSSINNPVEDARLAAAVFKDQWKSFSLLAGKNPLLIDFYRFCFKGSLFNLFSGTGISCVFAGLAPQTITSAEAAMHCFLKETQGRVCAGAAVKTLPDELTIDESRPAVAYCMAWLQVAGGNSVMPPWVRHRFPQIPAIIKRLRMEPCGDSSCSYCAENNDPEKQLSRTFGYPSFREKPQIEQGQSLQRAIVLCSFRDVPVLGILPTGGGKSLCYQLPALVRYWRNGSLTIVISPLQALMKDQVDNLVKKTGVLFADAVYGLQTAPERGAVFERIRLGDTAILYMSPEQLRSTSVRNVLRQREIGCWVFDEAHCLSKWGHDFRPDYLYAARFIREFAGEQNLPVPPVCCFTATAKKSVIEEISQHFREELDQDLLLFEGGVERENLSFEVIPVSTAEKLERTNDLIEEELSFTEEPAGIIVYAATRRATEEIRDYLHHQGKHAEAFHAGLDAALKRDIIEAFITGKIPVICATNAFGMGIDKDNIRLVLHYEMPGSLENYIQEAGRAGRDMKPARCVLLYDSQDAGMQFNMGALSEVKRQEVARILRALRRKKRNEKGEIVVTSDELLRDEDLADLKSLKPDFADTKVKAAVSWLERAGFLQRNQNLTDVFQGKPLVTSIEEAEKRIARLGLSSYTQDLWLNILQFIFNLDEDGGVRADAVAESLFPEMNRLQEMEKTTGLTAAQIVITALHDMADAGLIDQGIMLSAIFRPKGNNRAFKILSAVCDLENRIVSLLREEDPDADNGNWVELNIHRLNQKLSNEGIETSPDVLRNLVKGISYDGKGFAASMGSFELSYIDRNRYQVRLQRSWESIQKTIFLRQNVAHVILQTLVDKAVKRAPEKGRDVSGDVHLAFTSDEISSAIKSDITLSAEVKKILPAIDRALMFLHEQKVITLQGGLAILRQAMTIRLAPSAKGRYYSKGDFEPLAVHYSEKRFQVHVMIRYATLATEKVASALSLVLDYFSLGRNKFISRYFSEDKKLLEKAATAEIFRGIVENLRNPVQISAVGSPAEDNLLVLAGPGSGKTTLIVHRCAYLLEVERIPARRILVLCFNHGSAMLVKKRLNSLVGKAARGVTVATYHGAAMRLCGISIRDMAETPDKNAIDFNRIITDAVMLLKGEKDIPGMEPDEMRDHLLSGFTHILVDEYQDIDSDQYDLVSAIAGRTLTEEDGRLAIMVVGDDDQNIYTFRGANVGFIRRFNEDYGKKVVHLIENYRSSKHIVAASNALIRNNRDRMKTDYPITVNRERVSSLPGGRWEHIDPVAKGCVQIISVKNMSQQAHYVKAEIDRLMRLDPNTKWEDFAVFSRTRTALATLRSGLEKAAYPLKTVLDDSLPLIRVREIRFALEWLKTKEKENARAGELKTELEKLRDTSNIWWHLVDMFLDSYMEETSDSLLPVGWIIDRLYEFVAEQRREKILGRGIFMSTIHSAKGMEFPHVFILDGDWNSPLDRARAEEERRILYVGMTRAQETLHLMKVPGKTNPFLKEIQGNGVMRTVYRDNPDPGELVDISYTLLGLDDIYMDYAANFPKSRPIHRHLASMEPDQHLHLRENNSKIEIDDEMGFSVARMSNEGADKWRNRLDQILEVRVVAMLGRNRNDSDEIFQDRIKTDTWELPLIEIVSSSLTKRPFGST